MYLYRQLPSNNFLQTGSSTYLTWRWFVSFPQYRFHLHPSPNSEYCFHLHPSPNSGRHPRPAGRPLRRPGQARCLRWASHKVVCSSIKIHRISIYMAMKWQATGSKFVRLDRVKTILSLTGRCQTIWETSSKNKETRCSYQILYCFWLFLVNSWVRTSWLMVSTWQLMSPSSGESLRIKFDKTFLNFKSNLIKHF